MPIGLAPTSRSRFEAHTIDEDLLAAAPRLDLPFNPGVQIRGYECLNQPNCQIIVEDFLPGSEFTWVFTHDEFQYCMSGEMEVEVWLPPLYSGSTTARIMAGTVYVYPVGARKRVKVIGDQPCRHICFCPPNPGYPFPTAGQLRSGQTRQA